MQPETTTATGDAAPAIESIDSMAAALESALAPHGFDLVAHTTVAAYHAALGDRGDDRAFFFEGIAPDRAVICIGNSRAAWPPFLAALEREPARRREEHPFDRWSSEVVSRSVVSAIGEHAAFDTRFAFEGGRRAFSALHLAHAAGLAWRGPASLAVHPRFGPWFALRAAVLVDVAGRVAPPPDALCERCRGKPCLLALARAQSGDDANRRPLGRAAALDSTAAIAHAQVRERWWAWLEVRDACPVGVAERYPDGQIRWHYAHDRSALG